MISRDAHLVADVGKVGVAFVAIERLVIVGEGGVEDVELAVVLVVADGDAHGGGLAAGLIERIARGVAHIFKGAVAFVEIKIIGRGVVADEQIGLAVVVDVDEDRAQAVVAGLVGHAGLLADVGKSAVAVVVEEMIGLALQAARAAGDLASPRKVQKALLDAAFAAVAGRLFQSQWR